MDIFNKKENKRLENQLEEERLSKDDEISYLIDEMNNIKEHFSTNNKYRDNINASYYDIELKKLDYTDRYIMLNQVLLMYYRNPWGRNIIDVYTNFICGGKFIFNAVDQNKDIQKYLDEFVQCPKNKMNAKFREIVNRTLRDGEVFIKFTEKEGEKFPFVRILDSSDIKAIITDEKDFEKVEYYHFVIESDRRDDTEDETQIDKDYTPIEKKIPADEIQHIKINVDSNVKRGRSILEPALKVLRQNDDWLNARVILNRLKSSIFLHKIVSGTGPEGVTSLKNQQVLRQNVTGERTAYKIPRPGSMIITNDNIKLDWIEPKINAKDTSEDGRQIRLAIAAAVGIPEFMVTSDASNANYSSSLVSQNPFIRKIKDLQSLFGYEFQLLFMRIIKYGIENDYIPKESFELKLKEDVEKNINKKRIIINKLKEQEDKDIDDDKIKKEKDDIARTTFNPDNYIEFPCETKTLVNIDWPPIIHTDEEELTRALIMQVKAGILSRETMAARLGYNLSEELERIRGENFNPELDDITSDGEKLTQTYNKDILRDKP